jgi:hypothetical protein
MMAGDVVEVQDAFQGWLRRRVVSCNDTHVYVCTANEFFSASRDHREPDCVGFQRQFVRIPSLGTPGREKP